MVVGYYTVCKYIDIKLNTLRNFLKLYMSAVLIFNREISKQKMAHIFVPSYAINYSLSKPIHELCLDLYFILHVCRNANLLKRY